MNHETALSKAREIADRVLAPAARENDKEGRFSTEAVDALGRAGLLGLTLATEFGGTGLGHAHSGLSPLHSQRRTHRLRWYT